MARATADVATFDNWQFGSESSTIGFPSASPSAISRAMFDAPKSRPSDPGELRVAAEGLVELAKAQALEIEKRKHQLAGHNRHRFGSKSGSADQLNLQLRLEEEETAAARITTEEDKSAAPEPKQKPKRKPLPPDLPRHEQVLSPGEVCKCGGSLRAIGEDVTEEWEYVPGRFIVNRIVRPRMACKCRDKIVQAALPGFWAVTRSSSLHHSTSLNKRPSNSSTKLIGPSEL